jgi:branched-chain amino acid transport system permease protein
MSGVRRDLVVGLVLLVVAAAVPLLSPGRYIVTQMTVFFLWATVVTQWNLVFGVAGIFSLAQMALFACGAYATAMLSLYLDWSLWAAMPVAALVTVVFSTLIGLACLRLRGAYVALLTLAIAQVMYVLIITDTDCFIMRGMTCQQFTGATTGLSRFGDLGFRKLLGGDWIYAHYFLTLALLVLAMIFSIAIIRGPLGLAFRALRDNPGYAVSRGISRFKYQLLVFALSAFFTGLAGAVYAAHFRVAGPNMFSPSLLLFLLSMIVVGGVGSIWGPLLGTALLMIADEGLNEIVDYRNLGLGPLLVAFVILLPQGVTGAIASLRDRLAGRRASLRTKPVSQTD